MTRRLALATCACLFMLAAAACGEEDPLARRLAERGFHQADVITYTVRDDGTLLVELEVQCKLGRPLLETLTVTMRQHDGDGGVLRQDRVPLDLKPMDATGILRLYTSVEGYTPAPEALSALVETEIDPGDYARFPEIQAVR